MLVGMIVLSLSSCYTHRHPHGHVPPGKAKKIYGSKSAKRHAPGQKKKRHKKGRHHHRHDVYIPIGW